jgi:hypothetical protein
MLSVHLPKESVVFSADLYEADEILEGRWLAGFNHLGARRTLNALVAFKPRYAITTHSADLNPKKLHRAASFYNDLFAAVEPEMQRVISKGFGAIFNAINTQSQQVRLPKYKDLGNYDQLPAHIERMMMSIYHGD